MSLKLKRVSLAVLVALSILVGILCMNVFAENASAENASVENISDVITKKNGIHSIMGELIFL